MKSTTGFSFRLEHLMAVRKVSGRELSRRVESLGMSCSPSTVSAWINGRSVPPVWKLVPLAHALHVPLRRLIASE